MWLTHTHAYRACSYVVNTYICITLPCSTLISVLPRLSNFESVDINTCLAIFLVFAMNCYVKEYSYSSFCKKAKSCDN